MILYLSILLGLTTINPQPSVGTVNSSQHTLEVVRVNKNLQYINNKIYIIQ